MNVFEKNLAVWIALETGTGILLGNKAVFSCKAAMEVSLSSKRTSQSFAMLSL